ncbi:hypothetical protein V495_02472 [Pseudogymnoascus sp. VKM F-4514 (FW-929)]|nr:hypothetical protein V495_02472 [Pseudogymnoascus sp. VKM F-4514 (FW-929)]KFY54107.1 hypothetical protein V497_07989 [Pseudogymnoascus sp. VKM F-4516 (FW-969)]
MRTQPLPATCSNEVQTAVVMVICKATTPSAARGLGQRHRQTLTCNKYKLNVAISGNQFIQARHRRPSSGHYTPNSIHTNPQPSLTNYLQEVELVRRQSMPDKTLLDIAAFMGYDALAIELLRRKPSPSTDTLLSAMTQASRRGNNTVIKLLVGPKAKILDPRFTFKHKSPIAEAAKHGHESTVKLLLTLGASLEKSQWCSDKSALVEAAEHGFDDIVKLLLRHQPVGCETWEHDAVSLRLAPKESYHDSVEALLVNRLKADSSDGGHSGLHHVEKRKRSIIDSQDGSGRTALHYAVIGGHSKIASHLLNAGANTELQSAIEHLAPLHAKYNVPVWMYCNNWTALHFAAADGNAEIATMLLRHGANIEAVDSAGQTALHLASSKGEVEIIHVLLQHNSKLEATDNAGASSLHKAAASGHLKIVSLLADQNCCIDAPDNAGGRALHKAAASGHLDIVRFLVSQNCCINATTLRAETPLHLAASNQHTGVAAFLLGLGIDVNAENSYRRTPLHLAVQNCDLPTIELLLASNAYLQAKDIEGKTPLHYAAGYSSKVYDLLLSHGANPETKDRRGDTPQYLLYHGPSM